jgi:hypothetical protein
MRVASVPFLWAEIYTGSTIKPGRLSKKAHLLRYAHHSSLRRTKKYASFLMISHALHPGIFVQPVKKNYVTIR